MNYSSKLVLKVNEIYHDIEEAEYEHRHPEIFIFEQERWKRIGEEVLPKFPKTILDMGTGTGFVPLQIGSYLSGNDKMICADISEKILSVCRKNIENKSLSPQFSFLKLDGSKIDLPDKSIDIITLNSVLHHLPDLENFFEEANRLLKPGGLLVIVHEPNSSFYKNKKLVLYYNIITFFFDFKNFFKRILGSTFLFSPLRYIYKKIVKKNYYDNIIEKVNQSLLLKGLIEKELTGDQISEIIDIHSPSAGSRIDAERGFDMRQLTYKYLPGYTIINYETYNHLGEISHQNKFLEKLQSGLKGKFPLDGADSFIVLKKAV